MKGFFNQILILFASIILIHNSLQAKPTTIYIISNCFHTSIILPAKTEIKDWEDNFNVPLTAQFIEFGWGARDFYMSKQKLPIGPAIRAAVGCPETVMHVVYLDKSPLKWFKKPNLIPLSIEEQEYKNLIQFIEQSFAQTSKGFEYLGPGLYGPSQFYKGTGCYSMLFTCNTWTARAIEKSGVKICALPVTANQVMNCVWKHYTTAK